MKPEVVHDDGLYLRHMLERCQRIGRLIAPGRQHFDESEGLQDGVIRNLEVIGEASKRAAEETGALLHLQFLRKSC